LEHEFGIDNVELSLVIPAYNEEQRLPLMVEQTLAYFSKREPKIKIEMIIVNDGSKDSTWSKILQLMTKHKNIDIGAVIYQQNAGKGYAVATGMKFARGKYILMLDADGATNISDYEKLRKQIKTPEGVEIMDNGAFVIGQRSQQDEEAKVFSPIHF
jgi:dolichyl-phosphate beta-glucosyltransferase